MTRVQVVKNRRGLFAIRKRFLFFFWQYLKIVELETDRTIQWCYVGNPYEYHFPWANMDRIILALRDLQKPPVPNHELTVVKEERV